MMSWAVGFDPMWNRDIGYGVPSICDHPECSEKIHRGLGHVCGSDPYGGETGCGLFFCDRHMSYLGLCERCLDSLSPFEPKPDTIEWIKWKLTHESWARWRSENPDEVKRLKLLEKGSE